MKCKALILIISTIIFPLTILSPSITHSATNYNINATVKISVCGNGIVEGGEDCDGKGTLSCDISCSLNTSQHTTTKQTQTPFLLPTTTSTTNQTYPRTKSFQSILPPALHIFDINKNGHITTSELPDILKMWILSWKNNSHEIKDLSILLYYVNR